MWVYACLVNTCVAILVEIGKIVFLWRFHTIRRKRYPQENDKNMFPVFPNDYHTFSIIAANDV